jgi:hypothetical protein
MGELELGAVVPRGLLESPRRIQVIGRHRADAALAAAVVPEVVAHERSSGVC